MVLSASRSSRSWPTIGDVDAVAELDGAGGGVLFAGNHFKERGFTGAVSANDADDAARRQVKVYAVKEQAIVECFGDIAGGDHLLTEAFSDRNLDGKVVFGGVEFLRGELFVAFNTRFVLRQAAGGIHAHPFQLLLEQLLAGSVELLGLFGNQLLLFEPRFIVALVGEGAAGIEFENPFGDVGEEVAVMGYDDERSGKTLEMLFQPADGFGVKVVGRFVEQEHIGIRE